MAIWGRWEEVTLSVGISTLHTSDHGFSFENQPSSLSLGKISTVSMHLQFRLHTQSEDKVLELQVHDNELIGRYTDMTTTEANAWKRVGFMTQLFCWGSQSVLLRWNCFQNLWQVSKHNLFSRIFCCYSSLLYTFFAQKNKVSQEINEMCVNAMKGFYNPI